jgi:two-component system chemotaxis response regulator CheB
MAQSEQVARPSFVVIGTSAGGMNALTQIFKELPADFPGAVLVVIHVAPKGNLDWAVQQLTGAGPLPVKVAEGEERIRQGVVYLAPADTHLLVEGERVRLGEGPPEQRVRPAVDALFRTAAATFGRRLIGVVLTGMLRDGTLGLRAVRDAGGITIVQNPESAQEGEMPRNAMENLGVDYCLELSEIGPLLELLVRRAGAYKEGVLETGLASALRLMKDRAILVTKLRAQSRNNPKTSAFLEGEIAALDHELDVLRRLITQEK